MNKPETDRNENIDIVSKLLDITGVREKVAAENNFAFQTAFNKLRKEQS